MIVVNKNVYQQIFADCCELNPAHKIIKMKTRPAHYFRKAFGELLFLFDLFGYS